MNIELVAFLIAATVAGAFVGLAIFRKVPKRVKAKTYVKKWRQIQGMCRNKEDWAHAIVHADMLFDEVMRKKKIPGKTTGERMVNAQEKFSSHDALWDAHKLANILRQDGDKRVREDSVKSALVAFRQALRDLGAIR